MDAAEKEMREQNRVQSETPWNSRELNEEEATRADRCDVEESEIPLEEKEPN